MEEDAEDGSRKRTNNRCRVIMKRRGQSRRNLEATQLSIIFFTRATLKVGTWNVMTMYAAWKLGHVTNDIEKRELSILGISERGMT